MRRAPRAVHERRPTPQPASGAPDPGRYARKRALVLLGVHVLFAIHVAHWTLNGRTLAPLELNEVVYTLELGIVTAGFLFMLVALASSAIFGRYFCSWGCHILALQDGAAWVLRRLGFKPRPLRSRLLAFAPLIVMAYMFVWPQIHRIAEGRAFPGFRIAGDSDGWASFVTSDFWRNLPQLGVALTTFFVCGFVMVLVLGTRSFCRYACPYGAAFALADRASPTRIRAVGACTGCGVCTAACDSQVRVHEEIGRYGMIVDANCLRDLDCVAICPKRVLSVVPSRPSVLRRVVGDTKVRHVYDLSPAEEVLAGVTAAGVTLALRGLYDVVPFFLSIALGIVTSAVAVTLARLPRRPDVTFLKRPLRRGTRLTGAGVVFLAASAAWLAILGHGGIVRWNVWAGIRAHERGEDTVALGRLERAWDLGLFPTPRAEALLADIHAASAKAAFDAGQPRKALHHLARIVVLRPASVEARCELGAILVETGELGAAIAHLREAVRLDPGHARSHHNLAVALAMGGAADEALRHAERASSLAPDDAQARAFRDHLIRVKGR